MFASIPPVTQALLILNAAVFVAQGFLAESLFSTLALWPADSGFAPWQLLTYAFLHGNILHLFVNMYALVMFGSDLERLWGTRRFVNLYVSSVAAAAITQLIFSHLAALPPFPTVGASGGVFGLLLAYAMYFPRRTVVLLIPPIPMPAWVFALLYGMLELALGVTGTQEGVAHFAHLGGMLGAGALIGLWKSRAAVR